MHPPISRAAVLRLAGRLATRTAATTNPRRLLVVKPDHMGDVLLATPALHALRQALPDASITLAVGPRSAEIARRLPDVDRVVVVPFPGLDPATQPGVVARWALLLRMARRWRGAFDAGVLLRDDFYWGAILLAAAGVPGRMGTAFPGCAPFLTHMAPPARHISAAAQHLQVATLLTGAERPPTQWTREQSLRFAPREAAREAIQAREQAGLPPTEPYLLLHPGAGAPVKLWTAEHWAAVVRTLQTRLGIRTLLVAGGNEQHLIAPILRLGGGAALPLGVAPGLDLLAALMRDARLVLGVDSGPLHLAVALDVPSVRLYGPVDPRVYGPWGDPERHRWVASGMLCAPCDRLHWDRLQLPWHPCVKRISPSAVAEVALAALESSPDRRW
jgi:ADP-heptose:LPS heptosyltransferase